MKKLNYFLLGAAALTLASCSNDDLQAPNAGDGNVNFTVKLPGDMGTRALSDGLTANNLHIAVYDADNDNAFVFDDLATFGGAIETTVSLNLPQGKTYNIAFFAVSPEADGTLYQWKDQDANPSIYVDYLNYGSDKNLADDYDCFFKLENISTANGPVNQEVVLTRPVAQINWGTDDLSQAVVDESAFGEDGKYIVSNFTMSNYYNNFGILTGNVTGTPIQESITIYGLASPASSEESADWQFPVDPTTYKYVSMQYVLAPANPGVYDLTLNIDNSANLNGDEIVNDAINVASAPVQANYRTNIYGSLLTNPSQFTVIKDKNWGTPDFDLSMDVIEFLEAVKNGGTVTLTKDLTLPVEIAVKKDVIINLNGHNLTFDAPASQETLFYVTSGASLTVNGNGNINVPDGLMGVWVNNVNSVVNINGGNWTCGYPVNNQKGKVYVTGGTLNGTTEYDGHTWTLNCVDKNYPNEANIYVTGGSFINFNPADNACEGAGTSFVEEGYEVVETEKDGQKVYTVVPQGTEPIDELPGLTESSKNGGDVIFTGNITGTANDKAYGSAPNGVTQNGGTIDGNGYTLTVNGANSNTWASAIYTTGGTIKNLTVQGAFRAIFVNSMTENLYIDNCKIYTTGYGINVNEAAKIADAEVIVTNSVITGWNSWAAGLKLVSFTDCEFPSTSKYSYLVPYRTSQFTSCTFDAGWTLDLTALQANQTVYFSNCTVNGTALTINTIEQLFDVELPAGKTVADLVKFN